MITKFKYFGLIIGILLLIISFLFFARNQTIYDGLVLLGFCLAVLCFLLIIFGKTSKRNKLRWTIVVLVAIAIQQFSEPFLIDISYRIYIARHRESLNSVNKLLEKHPETLILDTVQNILHPLSANEQERLLIERKKLGVYLIERNNNGIYYGLWGFLDIRLGITYWMSADKPDKRFRHLEGAWFR